MLAAINGALVQIIMASRVLHGLARDGLVARVTSFIALSIFAVVNLSLWRLKRSDATRPAFCVPIYVPVSGAILSLAMIANETYRLLL